MNPTLSFTLSFFLFAYISNLSSINAAKNVLDINGKPVVSTKQYYIFPDYSPKIGGLNLNKVGDDSKCPLTVLQNDDITGLPVKFTIAKSNANNILRETFLDIEFTEKPDCAESSKWLLFVDANTQLNCVGIGGPANYPGAKIISGKFSIMQNGFGDSYLLVFCSDVIVDCSSIGLESNSEEGGSRLILTESEAYSVVFVDAASVKSESIVSIKDNRNSSAL